eukprot:11201434-Alexandrium_andersonii.AAC.1
MRRRSPLPHHPSPAPGCEPSTVARRSAAARPATGPLGLNGGARACRRGRGAGGRRRRSRLQAATARRGARERPS